MLIWGLENCYNVLKRSGRLADLKIEYHVGAIQNSISISNTYTLKVPEHNCYINLYDILYIFNHPLFVKLG